jgi:hypothetical protein
MYKRILTIIELSAQLDKFTPPPIHFILIFVPMHDFSQVSHQIQVVKTIEDLLSASFQGDINAICWQRNLKGDFAEIVKKADLYGNITTLDEEDLLELNLSAAGQVAREVLLTDMRLLEAQGASPILNVIREYERDDALSFFPTDVYSYHVDRSPIPLATFLCTYHGAASEIIPNDQATQKILLPSIREELNKVYDGPTDGFESFLTENFFDLHYQAHPNAQPVNVGIGHLWKIACDFPNSPVLPCLHRAPLEKPGEKRLLLIC